jgi:S-layer protein (TIGR01567 family)
MFLKGVRVMRYNTKLNSAAFASSIVILFLILVSSTASAAYVTCNVIDTHYKCDSWSNEKYPLINLFGEKDVPLFSNSDPIWKCHVNKLAKLVLDSNHKYDLKTGETLDLGQGYTLIVMQVAIDNRRVWIELVKDGQYVNDELLGTETGDMATWTCMLDNIQGVDNVPVLKVHINKIYQGKLDSFVQIDGIWLIDYANARTLKIGDKIGSFKLHKIITGVNENELGSLIFK